MITPFLNVQAAGINVSQVPLYLAQNVPPLLMLVMGRDHKLYYEAYNDASDLNDDSNLDVGYDPDLTYFGYFDSFKCYDYTAGVFEPVSVTTDKTCTGQWSGDFLNYLTTARIDALRKVLFGGDRVIDDIGRTVLERTYIPQDAHSWGKEYESIDRDGYDIRDYTPLPLPAEDTRHLFANTTPGIDATADPLLRVLTHSDYRIWEWVSIERPVAGTRCLHGSTGPNCERASVSGGANWEVVPPEQFQNLSQTTYDLPSSAGHPDNHSEYNSFINQYATASRREGSGPAANIDGSGNPFGDDNYYMTIFEGEITVPESGTYTFAVDGDDAVELLINSTPVAGWYGGHGDCNCQTHSGSIFLTEGVHDIIFRHEDNSGGDSYTLYWQVDEPAKPASEMTDYIVQVEVCDPTVGLEDNCQAYGATGAETYKPTGILQEYGEEDLMMFGLITGSYRNNLSGGVLRKNISSFTDEINLDTGQFTSTVGIVDTINKLRIKRFTSNNYSYTNCGWIVTESLGDTDNKCHDWGNPIAEMMYEGIRYFAGKAAPTTAFNYSGTTDDSQLGLPQPAWEDPYASSNQQWCAQPVQLVISDINPSYDTDELPGSAFGGNFAGDMAGLNVSALGDLIWDNEPDLGGSKQVFIGQAGTISDNAPSEKTVTSFGNIRGLSPEEPSKRGGYYAASVAYYGLTEDLHSTAAGEQLMSTFAVALASPLPRIEIPVANGEIITIIPFAKSVDGWSGLADDIAGFQPTNTIVDFYVETIEPDYGKFRINFEDVEQGADHDMDAIVEYEYQLNNDGTVTVSLNSIYAAGGIEQHMGYVISGTTADGIYLEVRDRDTSSSADDDYYLDTPPGSLPYPDNTWQDGRELPLTTARTFIADTASSSAILLNDPLWYAAKWGGFQDDDGNELPNQTDEWDQDGDGQPDNYFLVTNALGLRAQLATAFQRILGVTSSSSSITTNSTRLDTDTFIYQARFNSESWAGELLGFSVNPDGSIGAPEWNAAEEIPSPGFRTILSYNPVSDTAIPFLWDTTAMSVDQVLALNTNINGVVDGLGSDRVDYLRGVQDQEIDRGGIFRNRDSILGDIVNSDTAFVGDDNFGYLTLDPEGPYYPDFLNTKANRRSMLYVGANDGMLHGFDASTGEEILAYVPSSVYPTLSNLTSPNYVHQYYVDGAPHVGDAYLNGVWRTILIGTQGAGGRTLFALDVTDPDSFGTSKVMWEFEDPELGLLAQSSIVRLSSGQWVVLVSNGYNSASQQAKLLVIDLATGNLLKTIDTEVGSATTPNGLSPVIPVDTNGDRITDIVYGGDLLGNLWKFDLSTTNSSGWDVAFKQGQNNYPLFTATDADGNPQPITARPEAGRNPEGGVNVYFGTGKFLETSDELVPSVQADIKVMSFYGILDNDTEISGSRETELVQQTIDAEVDQFGFTLRATSSNLVDYNSTRGWYLDLVSPLNGREGERVVSRPVLRDERIIFTTLIPSEDPCEFGGTGWLMELAANTGQPLEEPPFDLNDDDLFNNLDQLEAADVPGATGLVSPSGKKSQVGIIETPGIISAGKIEYKYTSGSSGNIGVIKERGDAEQGRQSWRQLY